MECRMLKFQIEKITLKVTRVISADQIREAFYGNDFAVSAVEPERNQSRMVRVSFSGERSIELTPTSRHILRQARKHLAPRVIGPESNQHWLPCSAELERLVRAIEASEVEQLSDLERTAVIAALESCLEDFDILSPLVSNPRVNDIIVRSFDDVSIQIDRHNYQTDYRFPDPESYLSFVALENY